MVETFERFWLGLSVVHTHRVLQSLKKSGLAFLRDGDLVIADWSGLAGLAEFDPECFRPQHDLAELAASRFRNRPSRLDDGAPFDLTPERP